MQNLPSWLKLIGGGLISGILIGGTGVVFVVLKNPQITNLNAPVPSAAPTPTPTPTLSPVQTTTSGGKTDETEIIKILIRDKKSKVSLQDADVTAAAKEGLSTKPTLTDGTVTFEVPKQTLGEVKIKVAKVGYITQELPKNFSINPHEIQSIDLETDTSNPNPSSSNPSLPTKIDWGALKSYFEIDDDANVVPNQSGWEVVTVHVTASKDFNATPFRAQPYDAYGVRTNIQPVTFSYSPPKWKKGDRSLVTISTAPNASKIEVIY